MKIYLVVPAREKERFKSTNASDPKSKRPRFSGLALTTIAALTPEKHHVIICDEKAEAIDYDIDADVVGITFMTATANRAYELASHYKKRGIVTVAGGYHATLQTDDVQKHFDIVVSGEAEDTWPDVLEDIERGSFKNIYRSNFSDDLTNVPTPRRELLEHNERYYITRDCIQTSRGCVNSCTFCSVTAFFTGRHRTRPLDKVLEEIKSTGKFFMFVDDNIIAKREHALALFKKMIPLKKRWIGQCSFAIAEDEELLDLAAKSGCTGLFIGIESINAENLSTVDKSFNKPEDYIPKIIKINKAGIAVQAGMIVGLDSDGKDVFQKNLEFFQKAGVSGLQLAILTPLPGTAVSKQLEKEGRIIERNWDLYDFRHTVIQPKLMTPPELQTGAEWLLSQFYRLDRVIARTLRAFFRIGFYPAALTWKMSMAYRLQIAK